MDISIKINPKIYININCFGSNFEIIKQNLIKFSSKFTFFLLNLNFPHFDTAFSIEDIKKDNSIIIDCDYQNVIFLRSKDFLVLKIARFYEYYDNTYKAIHLTTNIKYNMPHILQNISMNGFYNKEWIPENNNNNSRYNRSNNNNYNSGYNNNNFGYNRKIYGGEENNIFLNEKHIELANFILNNFSYDNAKNLCDYYNKLPIMDSSINNYSDKFKNLDLTYERKKVLSSTIFLYTVDNKTGEISVFLSLDNWSKKYALFGGKCLTQKIIKGEGKYQETFYEGNNRDDDIIPKDFYINLQIKPNDKKSNIPSIIFNDFKREINQDNLTQSDFSKNFIGEDLTSKYCALREFYEETYATEISINSNSGNDKIKTKNNHVFSDDLINKLFKNYDYFQMTLQDANYKNVFFTYYFIEVENNPYFNYDNIKINISEKKNEVIEIVKIPIDALYPLALTNLKNDKFDEINKNLKETFVMILKNPKIQFFIKFLINFKSLSHNTKVNFNAGKKRIEKLEKIIRNF